MNGNTLTTECLMKFDYFTRDKYVKSMINIKTTNEQLIITKSDDI